MKEHVFRLQKGMDLKKELTKYIHDNDISAAVILCAVGSLLELHIRLAGATSYLQSEEHYEIVSLCGTLCKDGVHLHIAVSKEDGTVIGGHLEEGTIINTTCEVVLGELEKYQFHRSFDEQSGYKELVVEEMK